MVIFNMEISGSPLGYSGRFAPFQLADDLARVTASTPADSAA
jgi:hypothetical protein